MDTQHAAVVGCGMGNFGAAQLGDRRRTGRLVQTVDRTLSRPGGTLPDKLQNPAELKGLYRLADAEEVTHAAVLEAHRQPTLERMRAWEGDVLIVHDTTDTTPTTRRPALEGTRTASTITLRAGSFCGEAG
ncbi:MAG: transposase DNA-binding-containing protein [Planctomycetota bacterium]